MDPNFLEACIFKLKSLEYVDKEINPKDYEETILEYLNHSPKDEKNYLFAIYSLFNINNFDLIESVTNEALLLHPDSHDILSSTLKSLLYADDFEKSIKYLDNLSKTSKFLKDILHFKALVYRDEEEYDKSLDVYNEILNDSRDLDRLSRKIKTLKFMERDDEALELLDRMIDDNDEKNWALVNKGLYYQDQDETLAMKFIDEVIENDPEYGFAY
ncbi:MAG: hypothetical protein LBT66_00145 [Methanobrevibacter sp.]|jgi:tetratricopeptide (TPR) repeat protein|nr:hypothetical protein [Candidatus Methanovirga meridionalis]